MSKLLINFFFFRNSVHSRNIVFMSEIILHYLSNGEEVIDNTILYQAALYLTVIFV